MKPLDISNTLIGLAGWDCKQLAQSYKDDMTRLAWWWFIEANRQEEEKRKHV